MGTAIRDTLSTEDVAPAVRIRRWNDFGSETLGNMTVDPHDRDLFKARITRMPVGNLGYSWMHTTPACARGLAGRLGGWAGSGGLAYLFDMQIQGRSRNVQGGRDEIMEPGDMVLRDGATAWMVDARESMRNFVIKIPANSLIDAIGDPEPFVGVPVRSRHGNARMASAILRSVHDSMVLDPSREWEEAITDIVLGAIKLAYGTRDKFAAAKPVVGSIQVQQVCRYIDAHLGDPTLSVESIAQHLGMGARSLQRLFVQLGKSPRQYLVDRRLSVAALRLSHHTTPSCQSITDIAFGVGFNDLSYFSRAFAAKFGVSPRDYRRTPGDHQH